MSRIFSFCLLICTLFVFGCNSIEPKIESEPPIDLIEKEHMVELMYEIQLIQAAYKGRSHNDTIATEKRNARMIQLLSSKNLTQETFEASVNYYHESPDDMEEIYESVITKLNLKIAQLEEKID